MGYGGLKKRVEEVQQDDGRDLMCSAQGCPCKWSVMVERKLCSYHAWESEDKWYGISRDLQSVGPWRLRGPVMPEVKGPFPGGFKDWAYRLQAIEAAGGKLTETQKLMYKSALRI